MRSRRGFPPSVVARLGGADPLELSSRIGVDDLDRIPIRPAPRWMARAWRNNLAAMTLPRAIYIRREVLAGDSASLARLLGHELVHARQWEQLGSFRFLRQYLGDYFKGRLQGLKHHQAYQAISLEKEAREVSGC
jgi:hypothetical protein